MLRAFLVIIGISSQNLLALTASVPRCPSGPNLHKNADLVMKAAMMGTVETRVPVLTRPDWKNFRGTGVLQCPFNNWSGSTIQLSGRGNLVTGAAHAFAPKCIRKSEDELAKCLITFPLMNSNKMYKIRQGSIQLGIADNEPGCYQTNRQKDWAVFELTEIVTGVNPYDIPPLNYVVPEPSQVGPIKVEQVASLASNLQTPPFKAREQRADAENFNIQECSIMTRYYFSNVPLQTNCHTGGGSSGAGQFTLLGGRRTIIAINSGESDPSSRDFNQDNHFNVSVPVEGELLAELHRRMKQ